MKTCPASTTLVAGERRVSCDRLVTTTRRPFHDGPHRAEVGPPHARKLADGKAVLEAQVVTWWDAE